MNPMRTMPRRLCRLAAMAAVACGAYARESYTVTMDAGVEMKTRDGVTLRADIYRPKADGKFPVILERAPYNKYIYIPDAIATAQRGYVFIVQDSRGRFASDGDWYPFKYEARDSYDAVEWAAALPCSNGKVGMTGISYVGVPQLLGATLAPPHLVAIYPGITASNYHENWIYQGGALCLSFAQGWTSFFTNHELSRRALKTVPKWDRFYDQKLPPEECAFLDPGPPAGLADYFDDWVSHPRYDDYWKQWSIEEMFGRIKVPALHMGAWYDVFLPGTLSDYAGIRDHGGSEEARRGQRLVIIPGGHAGFGRKIGDVDFGPDAPFDFYEYGRRWFDWKLKGDESDMAREKPVRIFVMGRNAWRFEDEWPLARARTTRYYLHSDGRANSLAGDGLLDTREPGAEPRDSYVFDPADPVPSESGPVDQRAVEARPDVLVYSTPAFARDTEVTGPVSLDLYVVSSAVDTDFTAKVVDVWPNGFAQNLMEGILRARYRNSRETPEFMNPGQPYGITVDLYATSNVFLAGHRLRVEVASSNYPRFDLNPNTGAEPGKATRRIKATNAVLHDRDHPSALLVPIVPD